MIEELREEMKRNKEDIQKMMNSGFLEIRKYLEENRSRKESILFLEENKSRKEFQF